MLFQPEVIATVTAAAGMAALALLGQSSPTVESMAPWAANAVNLGFVGWLTWYTQTKTIPQIVADNRAEQTAARQAFREELAEERRHCQEHRQRILETVIDRKLREDHVKRGEHGTP